MLCHFDYVMCFMSMDFEFTWSFKMKNDERREFTLNTIPDARFVRVVLHAIDQRMKDAAQMKNANPRFWENFCLFLGEVYMQMRINGDPLLELQKLLFKILRKLSSSPCTENLTEVSKWMILTF